MSGDKRNTGLIGKYRVERLDGKPVDWAFVLQDTDPYTPYALMAYAKVREQVDSLPDHLRSPAVRRVIDILTDAEGSGQ